MSRWKIDLTVLWFGTFLVMGGMTMIMPFLPLYIRELGIEGEHEIAMWAGAIFAGNFVTSFLFQPLWGKLSDQYGRKIMLLRSGFGMAVVIILMGFSQSAWQLLALRLLNGVISGFNPAAISLISATAPKERMGFAMGVLQSGTVAGTILGPLIGGVLADLYGFRPIFYLTGSLLLLSTLLIWLLVREKFDREKAAAEQPVSILAGLSELRAIKQLPVLFSVTFIIQFAMLSAMPIMTLFVEDLHGSVQNLALLAGLVGSITGVSNMIASPLLGRLSDKIGPSKILLISLFGAALTFIPQAYATSLWQLFAARFVLGMFMGGMIPTVNSLIRKYTPDGMESRSYAFNSSFLSLGNMVGPIVGGLLAGVTGFSGVFLLSGVLLLLNGCWVYAFTRAMARPS
jgi:DHA1 family multidrug resistance protein-like MFS transporter